jgi:hypothetical protein
MHMTSDCNHPYIAVIAQAGARPPAGRGDTDGSQTTRRCSWCHGPGNFRKNPNRFPYHSGVLKLLLVMSGADQIFGFPTSWGLRYAIGQFMSNAHETQHIFGMGAWVGATPTPTLGPRPRSS